MVTEVIEARGGAVIELTGDAATRVLRHDPPSTPAALDLQARFVAESERDPLLPLPVGVGIDTGEAVPVGGGFRGRALNLAARTRAPWRVQERSWQRARPSTWRVAWTLSTSRTAVSRRSRTSLNPVTVMRITGEGDDPACWFAERFPAQQSTRGRSGRRKLALIGDGRGRRAQLPRRCRSCSATLVHGTDLAGDALGIVDIDSGRIMG